MVLTKGRKSISLRPEGGDYRACFLLLFLCLLGGVLSFLAVRPDLDDVNLIGGRAVYFLANDTVPLDLNYHHNALVDFPVYYLLQFAHTMDLLWGYFAYVGGLPVLDIFHFLGSFLGGMLIPAAWFLALSRFARPKNQLLVIAGVIAILAYLAMDGETHRTFGNFAFVRIWQGKALLMSVFVPLFAAFSLDWFHRSSPYNWFKLFVLGMLAAGLTSTAVFLVPLLSLVLALGYVCAAGVSLRTIKGLAGYFASLGYLVGVALYMRLLMDPAHMQIIGFEQGFPFTFLGQHMLVFQGWLSRSSWTFYLTTVVSLMLLPRPGKRFLAGWLISTIVLVLNPLAMSWIAYHLSTINAYWRLFYVLPFPLTVGIATSELLQNRKTSGLKPAHLACAILLSLALVLNLSNKRFSVFVHYGFFTHKVDQLLEPQAQKIIAASLPGPMIAPYKYNSLIPMFTQKNPQICIREENHMLMHAAAANGQRELGESRGRAAAYVSGQDEQGLEDLKEVLALPGLRNVVIDATMRDRPELQDALRQHGFSLREEEPSYLLFIRP
ncbi:MAG: hypothetical protein JSV08_05005 [Acidobacteriota bacterium]|nr:MAG: hypothetical protein JSV08_05005 [Acidobacteriota bacterium]